MMISLRRNQIGSQSEVQELEKSEDRHQSLCGNHLPVGRLLIDPLLTKRQMGILSLLICFSKEIPNRPVSDRIKHPFKQLQSLRWRVKGPEQDPICRDLHNRERKNRVKSTTTLRRSIRMRCLTSSSRRRWCKWPMTSSITSLCWLWCPLAVKKRMIHSQSATSRSRRGWRPRAGWVTKARSVSTNEM